MFGLGWTEMLVVGIAALIVIGPKDLPVVMNRIGKTFASIRRMGSEFQREINKASGLDQVTDLRRSITEPLKQTAAEIRNEFNKPLQSGGVEPSGLIKPADPAAESVVKEIHEKVGMVPPPGEYVPFTKLAREKREADEAAKAGATSVESPAPIEAIAPVKKPRAPRKPKAAADSAAPVADLLTGTEAAPAKPKAPRKPRAAKPKTDSTDG